MRRSIVRRMSVIAVIGALALAGCTATSEAAPESPSPTVIPPPQPVALPHVAQSEAAFEGWTTASDTVLAGVLAESGDAASGQVAIAIDARAAEKPTRALEATIAVTPKTDYVLTAQVRAMSELPVGVGADLFAGSTSVRVPDLNAQWQSIEMPFATAAGETSVSVGVDVAEAFPSLSIDDIEVRPADGGDNIVSNPSFEDASFAATVTNTVLVLDTTTSALGVTAGGGELTWEAVAVDGQVAGSGAVPTTQPVTTVSLESVPQGYYTLRGTDDAGGAFEAPVAIVETSGVGVAADERLGVSLHLERDPYAGSAREVAALGFSEGRNDILWQVNEKERGVYQWDEHYVTGFAQLRAQGVGVLGLMVYKNPNYDGNVTPSSPDGLAGYANYSLAAAEAFDLDAIEVYNEFNHDRFNKGACGVSAGCYLEMLKTVYDTVKPARPQTKILAGSTANYDSAWFADLWSLGGLDYADAVSFHPYEVYFGPEGLANVVATARNDMTVNGGSELPVWVTELGWTTVEGGVGVSDTVQAQQLIRAAVTSLASGVVRHVWYDLVDDDPSAAVHEGNFGLFEQRRAGLASLPPKQAAFAQALLAAQLDGQAFRESIDVGADNYAAKFGDGDDAVVVAWSKASTEITLPSAEPVEVVDINGRVSTLAPVGDVVTVALSTSPVFIHLSSAADEPDPEETD